MSITRTVNCLQTFFYDRMTVHQYPGYETAEQQSNNRVKSVFK
jgi:hypothetical protein